MRYIASYANDAAIQAAVNNKTLGKPYVALDDQLHRIDWNGKSETPDYSKMYLTVEALEDGIISLPGNFYYSKNSSEWQVVGSTNNISVENGDKVRFKNVQGASAINRISSTNKFIVYGNIMSIVCGDTFAYVTSLSVPIRELFTNTKVVDASNLVLPATTLIASAYTGLFYFCGQLEKSPYVLPATILSESCYESMFYGCAKLEKGPEIRATILANKCYKQMYRNCSTLNYIKCLATDISATDCLQYWVAEVPRTGTFVKKAGVSWPTGISGIPSGWNVIEE